LGLSDHLQHPIQRLYVAEDLVRRRRAGEQRRHVASQRSARIDPNPHQIDAVTFALARLSEGGCILADEVGLGKTIEAGLVIAQRLAEGARRVLVITPKSLLGQWKQELFTLFSIDVKEVTREHVEFGGEGVLLATRDLVGSERGALALAAAPPFDLCVIDEAHEIFAGIYKRFDLTGVMRGESSHARMAARLSKVLLEVGTPILLLTATPIQNSLLELWGLVHYIDPSGTLLGDISTFRDLFCPYDEKVLAEGQEHELQRRLTIVLKRTLRRQAQEFMREPFVGRQSRLFEYTMSPQERELYDDITTYLLEPNLHAFGGNQRKLLLLGFHRRMASSLAALSASLSRVADRLRRRTRAVPVDDAGDAEVIRHDLEDDEDEGEPEAAEAAAPVAEITAELARVERFIVRARELPTDGKAHALMSAIRLVMERSELGKGSGKVVIFTESLTTQDYLRTLLLESRLVGDGDITLFRGTNDAPRAMQAVDRWFDEVGRGLDEASRPSPDIAVRLALVHEFRTRSRILISTEAGAKGLNLQFCDTVVNYDLPWNPQRIEQRIGRAHRYGQRRDVTVINFIAKDNEAQRLTFEILSQKLDLFGVVLGASDEVLHRPATASPEALAGVLGAEFEAQLRRIYERARTIQEVEHELRELRDAMVSRRREFDAAQRRTEEVIQSRFDSTVKQVFSRIQHELPGELAEFDRQVERVVTSYLDAIEARYQITRGSGAAEISVAASALLPPQLRGGVHAVIGSPSAGSPLHPLHLGHPLVIAAVDELRVLARARPFSVRVRANTPELTPLIGQRGRVRLVKILYRGFETSEQLLPVAVLPGGEPLPIAVGRQLIEAIVGDAAPPAASVDVTDAQLDDAVEEILFVDAGDAGAREQPRFERTLEQIERFVTDRVLLLERQKDHVVQRLAKAEAARAGAVGAEQRDRAEQALARAQRELEQIDGDIARLRAGDDDHYQHWRQHTQDRRYAAPEVEHLLDAEFEII
jgi:adenine-specific DNA-methyltransferase